MQESSQQLSATVRQIGQEQEAETESRNEAEVRQVAGKHSQEQARSRSEVRHRDQG